MMTVDQEIRLWKRADEEVGDSRNQMKRGGED